MRINRFFTYLLTLLILAGCGGGMDGNLPSNDWYGEHDNMTAGTPLEMYGRPLDGYGAPSVSQDATHHMAVLLPLSGDNAQIGRTIRTSVEIAALQNAPKGLNISFYDTNNNLSETIKTVLAGNPEIIIGPVFSSDAKLVRESRPDELPVISFTSDAAAIGDGVMTLALMPTNSIETIIQEMKSDNIKNFIILSPDTESGHLMAGTAKTASDIYDIPLSGIFFYKEQDPESIKNTASSASMHNARVAAHTRARQVLSDILVNERITAIERSRMNAQLDKLSKTETLGKLPYDAVLFLGNGEDTRSLASYLRYYDVSARDARFYGTSMWDGSDISSDVTMSGAKFAALSEIKPEFSNLYERTSGVLPNRLATFGYDVTNMAIGMIYSDKSNASYLLDPSGYIGTDGLFRMLPTGASERALQIVELNGSGTPRVITPAASNFMSPLYNIDQRNTKPADAMDLETPGIDPDDYIFIPEHLSSKYRSKTIGTNITEKPAAQRSQIIAFLPEDDSDPIKSENYKPVKLESVSRNYIDEYEIIEE